MSEEKHINGFFPEDVKPLPHDLDNHIDHIDAAIFTGDTFNTINNINKLQDFIQRWNRQLELNIISIKEMEEENNEE
jgi:hypothetical protein